MNFTYKLKMVPRKLFLLVDSDVTTGIGKYAMGITKSINTNAPSIIKDRNRNPELFLGTSFHGFNLGRYSSGYYLNERFPLLAFRKLELYLKSNVEKDSIVHYATPSMFPFKLRANSVVTIHDLFAIQDTDSGGKVSNFVKNDL